MAKIIGLRSGGSRAPGCVFATSFVIFSNRYGSYGGYNYVRKYVQRSYDANKFYRIRARQFGIAVSNWPLLTADQRNGYSYSYLDPLKSSMERYIDDYTWLGIDPFSCSSPSFQGSLVNTPSTDHIKSRWECLEGDYTPHSNVVQIWLLRVQDTTFRDSGFSTIQRRVFKPVLSSGKYRFYFYHDYDYIQDYKSTFEIIFTSGQNMRSNFSPFNYVNNPSGPPGSKGDEECIGGEVD